MEGNNDLIANFQTKVNRLLEILKQPMINSEEEKSLTDFVDEYWQNYLIFTNEETIPSEIKKIIEIGRVVIADAFQTDTPGSQKITNEFTKKLEDNVKNSQSRGTARTLRNPNFPTMEPKNEQNLDMNGFTSIILIIVLTIILGAILAAIVINR